MSLVVSQLFPRTVAPQDVLVAVAEAIARGASVILATVVTRHGSAPATPGQKLALIAEGSDRTALGSVGGGAVERAVLIAMEQALDAGEAAPKLSNYRLGPALGMCCGGSVDVLVEPLAVAHHVLIVGAGHVGAQTAPLLATLGFAVVLCDAREAAVDPARLPAKGARLIHADHDDPEVVAALPSQLSRAVALVMTHDHQLDQAVIEWALARGFGFVGGVGSRAKAVRTRARLSAKGAPEADIERFRMPVGLDIGARSPAEIAVSIAAELVQVRAAWLATPRSPAPSAERDPAASATST